MKKIVIIGDSLSLPRPDDGINFECTYPYLLSKELDSFIIINRSRRANDTKEQTVNQNIMDDIVYLKPDILIIHLGIVDCAPRIFSRNETTLLKYLKFVNKYIIKFASRHRYLITKIFKKVYVKPNEFQQNLEVLIKKVKEYTNKVYIVNIANTNEENINKSYGFIQHINTYNEILENIAKDENIKLIDINSVTGNILLDDGIHLNENGNIKMSQILIREINKC